MTSTCKDCRHFNWKLSLSRNWGECLNPQAIMRISLKLTDWGKVEGIETLEQYKAIQREVAKYARVQFEEETFGCIHFEESQLDLLS